MPLMLALPDQHPELQVELVLNDRWFDAVEEGIDVAVRIGPRPDARLVARRLGTSTQVCLAAHGEPRHAQALAQHQCLVNVFVSPEESWTFAGPDGAITVPVRGPFRTNNIEAIRAAVLAGQGIAVGATWLFHDDIAAGRVKPILRSFVPAPLEICALHGPGVRQPAKVTEFAKLLAQRIPKIRELGALPRRWPADT